jgi:transposase-like protein
VATLRFFARLRRCALILSISWRVDPQRRPHYPPTERLAILELRAAHGWSQEETARRFQITPLTIHNWMQRLDDDGPDALVQIPEPVNRFIIPASLTPSATRTKTT